MPEQFTVLGYQPYNVIAERLHEIGDHEAAQYYEAQAGNLASLEEGGIWPRAWLNTQHQYGFLASSQPGSERFRARLCQEPGSAAAAAADHRPHFPRLPPG